ncbi:probable isoprenylcysteine alpha-carbonyl methylesterase ICMEL1 isoform X2 [Vitis vinifera]|uniref:probable isoprenylcysteine alpha-carbonyl methylesterase ICMEL1 isoform X2 n=1 Tax=Vitis vinifera TaxID=29760 RepID=UPI0008FED3EB|nr:probable isoprenylcysteine alpha-carbonyl methylesterase ICMEL1 isoform X2 [Vitis vinifera]|eukprot:XP_019072226.1 PREDICTED: probable isoprenylcysteine alpha-carbonyl methylesterase ICMEL1 isoform X2 [Vitis vinifera]
MNPPMLPITNPSASSAMVATTSLTANAATMLIQEHHDETARLLIDGRAVDTKPFLPRASSYTSTGTPVNGSSFYQQRRRRIASDTSLASLTTGGGSRSEYVAHAASETYLLTRLGFKLLRYLGVGYRWITRFLALGCYALLLMPGFIQVGYYYFFSSRVRRGIVYGDQPRNSYKAWGSLLGQQLSERDIIVACIDYRNFPQGTISDMVNDASLGVSFVCNNIAEYGGDPNRIYLMGQSAGAHIAACTLLEQAIKECGEGGSTSWSVAQIKAYFGLSGGYNLFNLIDHFHSRGLYRSIFLSIMEGEQSLHQYSPEVTVQDPNIKTAVSRLPPIILFHGTADYSIPADASKSFAETLQRVGVKAESIMYEGRTHTDVFLHDPMRGGRDDMFEDLVAMIHANDPEALAKDAVAPPRKRLVPEFMLKLARAVSPF